MVNGFEHDAVGALADLLKQLESVAALELFLTEELGGSDSLHLSLADGLLLGTRSLIRSSQSCSRFTTVCACLALLLAGLMTTGVALHVKLRRVWQGSIAGRRRQRTRRQHYLVEERLIAPRLRILLLLVEHFWSIAQNLLCTLCRE